jgi:20S proteasome alpha/beta subunit
MTCIAAVADGTHVYMGGDSAGIAGLTLQVRGDPKVFKRDDRFIIGFTSSFRMGNILRYQFTPPELKAEHDIDEYMVDGFAQAAQKCFREHGFATVRNEQVTGGQFLVGVRGRIFIIDSDFQVGWVRSDYAAVGCGADAACGSLHATAALQVEASQRVKMALEAAEQHSAGVRGPWTLEML